MRLSLHLLSALPLFVAGLFAQDITQGSLRITGKATECPLRHTAVKAEISGMVARVNVTQEFHNALDEKIEAVYVFPLPHNAAVDRMTMTTGGRTITGKVREKNEARAMYDAARQAGHVAALLDQHRPNVFSQSVANIEPGADVRVEISYVETLALEAGQFEFVFPMVVAPRYRPSHWLQVTPAPPVTPEGTRAGHDISVEVSVDAGLPIGRINSSSHEIDTQWINSNRATVRLKDQQSIPNKDFLLRYESASGTIQDTILTHYGDKGGYFALMLEPPRKTGAADARPKELVFVLDTSGSMAGFPIEKAKEAMLLALNGLYPNDTFNLITFSGDTEILFPAPVAATPENIGIAKLFLQSRSGSGGTEMMKAIRAALEPAGDTGRLRIVCFMTDGEVGSDLEILGEVQRHPDARVFAFGIGSSVNRFLLDGMAHLGRGEVEYVGLKDDGSAAARRFWQRVRDPLMTDLEIDWGGLPVTDVYPKRIPDLFGTKPVIITGRYTGPLRGSIQLRGKAGTFAVRRDIAVDLPATAGEHDALASLWARHRVDDLMTQSYQAAVPELEKQIAQIGVEYGIATQYTSFIAVEEQGVTTGGESRRVEVPVELPEGMSYAVAPAARSSIAASYQDQGYFVPAAGAVQLNRTDGTHLGAEFNRLEQFALLQQPPSVVVRDRVQPIVEKLAKELRDLAESDSVVTVRLLVKDSSTTTLDALRRLGLEILSGPGPDLLLNGRINARKLLALTTLDAVRYIVRAQS
jgi:Ca-activated chloride channel family protein